MRREPAWRRYLRFFGPDPAGDIDDEFQFHLESRIEELTGAGMRPAAARREAMRQFGPVGAYRKECGAISRMRLGRASRAEYFAGWARDVKYAARLLARSKGSTAAAVAILALGIGASTAVFTVLDRMLLAPLPVPRPSELQLISCDACRYRDYLRLRDSNGVFSGLAATGGLAVRERRGKEKIERPAEANSVSGNFFRVLQVQATAGRVPGPEDDAASAPRVAVASYRYWKAHYAAPEDVLGRTVYLNDAPFTIIGALPRGFTGLYKGWNPEFYIPLESQRGLFSFDALNAGNTQMIGRLRPGTPAATAEANLKALLGSLPKAGPGTEGGHIRVADGSRGIGGARGEQKRSLLLVGAIVALLLAMGCVNVACLLMARGAARSQEIAVRLSLGAGRWRIVRQSLVESCLVAVAGGAAGLVTAVCGARALLAAFQWQDRPIDLSPDWRVAAFGLGVSLAAGIVFGVAPAIYFLRGARAATNQERTVTPRFGAGKALVVLEAALSLALVAGAAVFTRSFQNLRSVPVGFSPEHVTSVTLEPADERGEMRAPFRETELLAEALRAAPGVEAAAVADLLTFDEGWIGAPVTVPGDPSRGKRVAHLLRVDDRYFDALRVRLAAGRRFTTRDDEHSPKVAIVSEGTARRLWGNESPLGRLILVGGGKEPQREDAAEIVGVVNDVKFSAIRAAAPDVVFVPMWQTQKIGAGTSGARLQIRSALEPQRVAALVQARIREKGLRVKVEEVKTLEQAIGASMLEDRIRMQASALFGGLALLLMAAGIYGLMAYSVVRRTREMGIRMAVGARPSGIVRLVLKESLGLSLLGAAIGLPGAIAAVKAVDGMLFGLAPIDAASLGIAAAVLLFTGVAASIAPAWRAARLDPVRALRVQ